jgi:AcrR family transcriptional regulator
MTTATSRSERSDGVDGRTARRLENRERILDAALELTAQGAELDMDEIAASAKVSVRSVYNHFPTARHLVAGMYERGSDRVRPFLEQFPGPGVPFDERVRTWVFVWGRIQDEIAPIRWQALIAEDRHPDLQPELAELRRAHRTEIKRVFPEITGKNAEAAALAITDSLTWRALRRHQRLNFDAACGVIEETLRRLAKAT